jgi:hypothetical protein
MTALFGWMTPGEVKHFPLAEWPAAIAWAAGEPQASMPHKWGLVA